MEQWIIDALRSLNPYVREQYIYATGMVSGLQRFTEVEKEIGLEQALAHSEVTRVVDWIYENVKDDS